MRNSARLWLTGVAIACSAMLLSGCAKPDPVVTPAPASSSKPLFATDADALAAATKAYAAYVSMADRVFMDGGVAAERMQSVATGAQLAADRKGFQEVMSEGEHSTGGTTFDQVKLQQQSTRGSAAVVIYVCEDISAVDVLDQQGKSLVSADRPNRVVYEITFDSQDPKSSKLLVALKQPWGDQGC